MIYQSHDATTVSWARLLPWSNLDGKPCYLLGDGTANSYLSRVADNVECVQLEMADELLGHAADLLGDGADLLGDGDGKATEPQLRFLVSRLVESLRDVHRIARSRGNRLAAPDGDDEPSGAISEG
ncbi:hypothetical protein EOT10_15510 [Streptomyces antnestii]|uniref:Uncharacterized protein n=1 Tax=Streptomyces antnestii TaxID=2494256 RepID=A0A437PQ14_9ACTN|nr:hypothetical protein [Streptomyces sp. San01]RVU24418.1 hypothetical protein EOT10_15510 [Streptomyces sp. San01]